jgi:gamma-tubulin complex component 2
MLNFSDLVNIQNNQSISFINTKNKQYLLLNTNTLTLKGNGIHPFLYNKEFESEIATQTEFLIILSSNPSGKNLLYYGNQISLMTKEQMFIVSTNNGEARLEPLRGDKTLTSFNLPPNSKFTLLDPYNTNVFTSQQGKTILFNDEVVLKSTFGSYLLLNHDFSISTNGMIINEECIWKMVKPNTPFLPDWISKRKFLNHNNISYLFSIIQNNNNSNKTRPESEKREDNKSGLCTLSLEQQEKCLVEDLILCMMGMEGNYIKRSSKKTLENFQSSSNKETIHKTFSLKFEIEPYLENPTCDPSLLYMVHKILPLSNHYDRICSFLNFNSNNIETGLICKAFCEGLNKIIRHYILFINQLEIDFINGNLDIQKLWYVTQPCLKIMENLKNLTYQCSLIKGGGLPNIIYNFYNNTTDNEMKNIYKFLLDKSIEPYLEMMKMWVCRGILNDVFQEFMVWTSKDYNLESMKEFYYDLYWDKKFLISQLNIIEFFQKARLVDKIFFIGKSLNILRECGKIIQSPYEEEFDIFIRCNLNKLKLYEEHALKNEININKRLYEDKDEMKLIDQEYSSIFETECLNKFEILINKIYEWTNSTMKSLLFTECNLESIFKTVKKFFFMECGDFFTHLIDLSDEMFLQAKNKINFEKLENIIDNALRTTSSNLDQNKELLSFSLSDMNIRTEKIFLDKYINILENNDNILTCINLIKELLTDKNYLDQGDSKILESLVMNIKIKFPLNLIFSKKSMIKYTIIFRQLLILKYEEKKLVETWILQQNFKDFKLQNYLKPSYLLIDKMINFLKNLVYYFFNEVIEPNYLIFMNNLLSSNSIDDILKNHDKFLDTCLKECLLGDSETLIMINNIIQTCLVYSNIIIQYYNSAIIDEKLIQHLDQPIRKEERKKQSAKTTYFEKKKKKLEEQNKILQEIFIEKKFLTTVERFCQNFENRLEEFLTKINKMYVISFIYLLNNF